MTHSPAFIIALRHVLEHEGGYVNDADDKGGPTYRGVTLALLRDWRNNKSLQSADLRKLTDADIAKIFHDRYWVNVQGDQLVDGVGLAVFNAAILSGVRAASLTLQRAVNIVDAVNRVGLKVDGVIGPDTVRRAGQVDPVALISAFASQRLDFFAGLSNAGKFGRGWRNREVATVARAASINALGRVGKVPTPLA